MSEAALFALIVVGFLIVGPAFWCAIVILLSKVSGWSGLARRYQMESFPPSSRLCSAQIGVVSYRNVLKVSFDHRGLGLGVLVFFRPGHPHLFIPWSDITGIEKKRSWFMQTTRISVKDGPIVALYREWDELISLWSAAR